MHKPSKTSLISSLNGNESPKKLKLFLQTPKHKHTGSLVTPKVSNHKLTPGSTLASKAKFSFSKYVSPSTNALKMTPSHKYTSSEQMGLTSKNSKTIKRKPGTSADKKSLWRNLDLPITPELTLRRFMSSLSPYEQSEVLKHPEVYFIGQGVTKPKSSGLNNFGFDDDKGDYRIIIGDHINYRFEVKALLGKGSFGQVVKVFDHKTQRELALKIIKNRPRFHQQAAEEVDILKYIKEKDPNDVYCVVHIQENFEFRKHMVRRM